jgi:Flp pilus assembly protein TadD
MRPPFPAVALLGIAVGVTASATVADDPGVDRLMASSVCVQGEVAGGRFDASGFVVPPGDIVLTTAHGISDARKLRVKTHDGRVYAAQLERLGNERADVALLTIVGAKLPPALLGSVDSVRTGDAVRTVGCPSGFEFTLTQGVVSSVRESEFGYPLIQTDVPVNPGSSGGALYDERGRVVGVIKGGAAGRERIYFALPIDLGKALLQQVANEREALEVFNRAVLESDPGEKVRLYGKAVNLRPDLVEGHYNLGLALGRLGRLDEAEKAYRETLRLQPDYWPAVLNLGANLYDQQRLEEAAEVYRQGLRAAPDAVRLRNNLAEVYRAMGKNRDARREFEAILERSPDYAPAHYGLAVLYDDELDDPRQAATHYRRYLALAPGAGDAAKVREWLRRAEEENGR